MPLKPDPCRMYINTCRFPSIIDQVVAVNCFRSQRGVLLNLIRHCLPSLANSLLAEGIIPVDVYDDVNNPMLNKSQRSGALLECVEARIEVIPSDLGKVVHILESEPFLKSLATKLVHTYCEYPHV